MNVLSPTFELIEKDLNINWGSRIVLIYLITTLETSVKNNVSYDENKYDYGGIMFIHSLNSILLHLLQEVNANTIDHIYRESYLDIVDIYGISHVPYVNLSMSDTESNIPNYRRDGAEFSVGVEASF